MNDHFLLGTVPGVVETAVNVTYEVCFIALSALHLFLLLTSLGHGILLERSVGKAKNFPRFPRFGKDSF